MLFDSELVQLISLRFTEMLEDTSRRILVAVEQFTRKAELLHERLIRRQCQIKFNYRGIANISEGVDKIAHYLQELGAELKKPVQLGKFVQETNHYPIFADETPLQGEKEIQIALPLYEPKNIGRPINAVYTSNPKPSDNQANSIEAKIAFKDEIRRVKEQMTLTEHPEKSCALKFNSIHIDSAKAIHSSSRKKRMIQKDVSRSNLQKGH